MLPWLCYCYCYCVKTIEQANELRQQTIMMLQKIQNKFGDACYPLSVINNCKFWYNFGSGIACALIFQLTNDSAVSRNVGAFASRITPAAWGRQAAWLVKGLGSAATTAAEVPGWLHPAPPSGVRSATRHAELQLPREAAAG